MIGIILTIIVFTFIGYILTTVFGYFYVGLSAAFIITASLTLGVFILSFAFTIGAAVIKGCTAGVMGYDYDPDKRQILFPEEPYPEADAEDRYNHMKQQEEKIYGPDIPTPGRDLPNQLSSGMEDRRKLPK